MTKAEIVSRIAQQTGIEKEVVMTVVEAFMENVKDAMIAGNNHSSQVGRSGHQKLFIQTRSSEIIIVC